MAKLTDEKIKEINFFISNPLRSANNLIKSLYSDDEFYETTTYVWVGPEDAKKLFLFGVCKEVIKACLGLMNDREFLGDIPLKEAKDTLEKIIYSSINDAQIFRIRKMIELFSILLNFYKNTNRDEEYRIYLSAENLNRSLSKQKEFIEFYDGEIISNTDYSIQDFSKRIEKDLDSIGKTEIWFLDMKKIKGRQPSIFAAKRKIYLSALEKATDDERVALGISYFKTYSQFSTLIHPTIGSHDYGSEENNYKRVIANIYFTSIICQQIMHKAYRIAGLEDNEGLEKIMGPNFEKSEAPKTLSAMKRAYEIGDIALTVWGDLIEVINSKKSRYGYTAHKIKYISRPPLPEYPEDWIESQHIMILLMPKSAVRSFFEKSIEITKDDELKVIMKEVLKQPDNFLFESYKKTFLDLHQRKLLIPLLMKSGMIKPRNIEESFLVENGEARGQKI